ncbi:MAG: hypothetical protein NVSMB57_08380 [Actinomycetota bacterium]
MEIRAVDSLEEIDAVLRVMHEVWRAPAKERLPRELLRALTAHSNVLLGAFEADECVGCVLGWWGRGGDGTAYLFSQRLGVLPSHRRAGVAASLKRAQASFARERGVHEVRWTFDPMRALNASFNFRTLGAIGIAFYADLYGPRHDALNEGRRTDRLLVSYNPGASRPQTTGPAQTVVVEPDARDRVRDQLSSLLLDGYVITGFEDSRYVLKRIA